MEKRLKKHLLSGEGFDALLDQVSEGPLAIHGVFGSAHAWLGSMLRKQLNMPGLLWVTESIDEAEKLYEDAKLFMGKDLLYFPAWEVALDDQMRAPADLVAKRMACLQALADASNPVCVISPIQALCHPTLKADALHKHSLSLKVGQEGDLPTLLACLADMGYERVPMVSEPGQFAARGGVVDLFLGDLDQPVRVEFFGDDLESLRTFDVYTQKSVKALKQVTVFPLIEQQCVHKAQDVDWLWAHLPEQSHVFFKDPGAIEDYARAQEVFQLDKLTEAFGQKSVSFALLGEELEYLPRSPKETLQMHSLEALSEDDKQLKLLLGSWQDLGLKVVWLCRTPEEQDKLKEYFLSRQLEPWIDYNALDLARYSQGFVCEQAGLAVVCYQDLFHRQRVARKQKVRQRPGLSISDFNQLKEGDYVVHVSHGVGIYHGAKRLDLDDNGQEREYICVEYRDGDMLYVPMEQVDLLQRYVGMEKAKPEPHKLGGKAWGTIKEKAEKSVRDLAAQMLKVQAQRSLDQGYCYPEDGAWQGEFEEAFPYEETPDQYLAIEDVKKDMCSHKSMDRLICGDVGFGKTEVAIRAAFRAVMDGKQVAVLVPTTVLAQQHYTNFRKRMESFPVHVEMLSRFRTAKEQKQILAKLATGDVDIIVGTHRLVQSDVKFKDMGLLVIDEEQRFGVAHKEKIKSLRSLVDVLTMSATPIPRTLYMSIVGTREMSNINTPPHDRLPVHSEVNTFDEKLIAEGIRRELDRGGQVFFLHNRVQSIHNMAKKIQSLLPKARLAVGHGQMHEKDLEKTMLDFMDHKFDVLVCTTIVESGVDIPNANTIFVNMADHFGLADLYQLRGRVGRGKHKAYAYFLVDAHKPLNEDARKRLNSIQEFNGLGMGYRIAMRDLELRGAGNILGAEQSGHIVNIGFDMYCALLRKTIKELKGERPDVVPCVVDLKLDLTVDSDYMPELKARMELYREIAGALSEQELQELEERLVDMYGRALPDQIKILFELAKLKLLAGMKGYTFVGKRKQFLDILSPQGHVVKKLPGDAQGLELIAQVWALL